MSKNTQWDSIQLQPLDLPYNRVKAELDTEPRIYSGQNSLISFGGKLTKRPGTVEIENTTLNKRCDRLWLYETLESPPKVYIIGSFYNTSTGNWQLYYNRLSTASGWVSIPTLRDSERSTRPHELVVSRGLAYIKSFPSSGSTEKLGTLIFDGSGSSTPVSKPWGILGPTEPTAIKGATTRLSAAISSTTATSISVVADTGFPSVPFDIQIDFEQMTVTAGLPGTAWTVTRAANGTTADTHSVNAVVIWRDWDTSEHKVDVNWYWRYTYCWETITGQVSTRAPVQTNIDLMPSSTGPFFDQIPKITYTGNSDTTNIPKIKIERTTDGGGTYYFLEEIDNPGSGTHDYSDDSLETGTGGGTFEDPVPDDVINTALQAPSLTSNTPPPTVLSPLVLGTDTPAASTPITSYSGRLWYGIGNVLFFSGNEEIQDGIPEESWPSGFKGNFFRFQFPVQNVISTADALYVMTLQSLYQLTGTSLETFSIRPIIDNLGFPYGNPRALVRWNDTIAFLTHDYRICMVQDSEGIIVSDELYTDIVDLASTYQAEFEFRYWGDIDKEYLIVIGHVKDTPSQSRQWILDLKKSKRSSNFQDITRFWNAPWTIQSTAAASGRINESTAQRRLIFYIWNPGESTGSLVYLSPTNTVGTDFIPGSDDGTGNVGFDFYVNLNQFQVPTGDHVNSLRAPSCTPVVYGFVYDRNLYGGDSDPLHYYYLDDFWTDPIPVGIAKPAWRRKLSKSYKTVFCPVNRACQHFSIKLQKIQSTDLFEMQNLTIIFEPDGGA